jgi:hypothetical protein
MKGKMNSLEEKELALQPSFPQGRSSILSLFRQILASSVRYKIVTVLSAIGYWLLYGYSAGMYSYYSFDVTSYIREEGIPNPLFGLDLSSLSGFYNSGLIWYPTGHIALIFFMGPMIFSIALSVLFGLSVILIVYNVSLKSRIRKSGGLAGFLAIIPAIFTGGCCSVPVATLLLGSVVPSAVLVNIEFDNPFLLNFLTALVMFSAIIYTGQKINAQGRSCSNRILHDNHIS